MAVYRINLEGAVLVVGETVLRNHAHYTLEARGDEGQFNFFKLPIEEVIKFLNNEPYTSVKVYDEEYIDTLDFEGLKEIIVDEMNLDLPEKLPHMGWGDYVEDLGDFVLRNGEDR